MVAWPTRRHLAPLTRKLRGRPVYRPEIVMTPSAEDTDKMDRAHSTSALAARFDAGTRVRAHARGASRLTACQDK